jgi:O-antigen/teichoic acid export membrane protein
MESNQIGLRVDTEGSSSTQGAQQKEKSIMINEAQTTIRNAGYLLAQRGVHIFASLLFAVLVPRMMGPGNYGRYILITSLYLWFVWGSDLGFVQIMVRYVPNFMLQGEKEKLKKFSSNFLAVGLLTGGISACLYLSFTALWLTDLDLFLLMMMTATLLIQAGTRPFFTLFLGLNQAARWGMGEVVRHWFLLVCVIIGFYLNRLRGAFFGQFLTECFVLFIGVWWGKSYFSWKEFRLDLHYLAPYLRFGLIFFVFNLLSSIFQHSGEVMVRLFYPDYVQVGFFGLAHNVYLTISRALYHFTIAFIPFMITLQVQGEIRVLKQWIENLINWLTVSGMFVVYGVLLVGNDLVPWVLGAAYQPVAANLLPLSITLWIQVLANVAVLLTVVYNRPKIAVIAAGIRLAAIWAFGPFLVSNWGSLGGCLAVLGAAICYAGYLTWRMQGVITYSLRKWAGEIVLGLIFLPLFWLRSSWSINVLLYGVFVIGYSTLLLLLRFVRVSDMATVWRALRSKGEMFNGSKA